MKFTRALVSSLPMLLGLAAGLTVPRGLPDGNYLGFITPDGDEIHGNLDTGVNITIPLTERRAVEAAQDLASALERRQKPKGVLYRNMIHESLITWYIAVYIARFIVPLVS